MARGRSILNNSFTKLLSKTELVDTLRQNKRGSACELLLSNKPINLQ
jgi:hypothetical protein